MADQFSEMLDSESDVDLKVCSSVQTKERK